MFFLPLLVVWQNIYRFLPSCYHVLQTLLQEGNFGKSWRQKTCVQILAGCNGESEGKTALDLTIEELQELSTVLNDVCLSAKKIHADHPEKNMAVFNSFHGFTDAGKFLDVWLAVSSQFCVFKSQTVWNHVRMRLHVDSVSPKWRKTRIGRKDKDKQE